jgi:hypothetical protein
MAPYSVLSEDDSTVGDAIGHEQRPGEQGNFSLSCSSTIRAPVQLLLAIILDMRTYSRWNNCCPGTRVTHQPRSTAPLPACLRSSPAVETIANLPLTLRGGTEFIMEVCTDPKKHPRRHTTTNLRASYLEQFTRPAPVPDDGGSGDHGNEAGGGGRPAPRVGVRLAWRTRGRVAEFLTGLKRVQEFIIDPRDPTVAEYVCWETYYGLMSGTVRHVYWNQIREGCGTWMDGLQAFAEGEWERQVQESPEATADAGAAAASR